MRASRAVIAVCLLAAPLWSADSDTVTVTVAPDHPVARGEAFSASVAGLRGGTSQIQLLREGKLFTPDNINFPTPVAGGSTTATATLPKNIPFGDYDVVFTIGVSQHHGQLQVRPPGAKEIQLLPFDPDYTYETQNSQILSDPDNAGDKTHYSQRTVTLMLRGSGFPAAKEGDSRSTPIDGDNFIWLNGKRQQIQWLDSCPSLGTENNPVAWGLHGVVNSTESVTLCDVPVSPNGPPNGAFLVAASYGQFPEKSQQAFTVYSLNTTPVALWAAGVTIVLAGAIWLLLGLAKKTYTIDAITSNGQIKQFDYKFKLMFLDPQTNTYSLSKLQFYLWTVAALFAYAYLYVSKVFVQHGSWPDIPGTLPGVIGISAGTAIGSQVVTSVNGPKGAGEERPSILDFITSGGLVAVDRVQMVLWTLFGVGAFVIGVLRTAPGTITTLAPVPDNMMYLMGLSASGYLGGKMARKPGPVVSELTVTPSAADETIAKAAIANADLPDFTQASVEAGQVLAALPVVTNTHAQKTKDAFAAAIKAAGNIHTTSDLNDLLINLAKCRGDAEAGAGAAAADCIAVPAKASQRDAAIAQQAAAELQDFSGDITAAISAASAPVMEGVASLGSVPRIIELRGTNLSPDGSFEIDQTELPFRMMLPNKDGQNAPEVVARAQDGGNFATVLRISIDPASLQADDFATYQKWFAKPMAWSFTIFNADGQKDDGSFQLT